MFVPLIHTQQVPNSAASNKYRSCNFYIQLYDKFFGGMAFCGLFKRLCLTNRYLIFCRDPKIEPESFPGELTSGFNSHLR